MYVHNAIVIVDSNDKIDGEIFNRKELNITYEMLRNDSYIFILVIVILVKKVRMYQ